MSLFARSSCVILIAILALFRAKSVPEETNSENNRQLRIFFPPFNFNFNSATNPVRVNTCSTSVTCDMTSRRCRNIRDCGSTESCCAATANTSSVASRCCTRNEVTTTTTTTTISGASTSATTSSASTVSTQSLPSTSATTSSATASTASTVSTATTPTTAG